MKPCCASVIMSSFRPFRQLVTCFLLGVSWNFVDGENACFRRYDNQMKACKGLLFNRSDIQPQLCCRSHGQGFANVIIRVENRKKWYECVPCETLDEMPRQESNSSNDGYDYFKKEAMKLGRRQIQDIVHEDTEEQEGESMIDRRFRPSVDSSGQKLASEQDSANMSSVESESGFEDNKEENRPTFRTHEINSVEENETTHTGVWSEWSSWTSCTVSCGKGTRHRARRCLNPPSVEDEKNCREPHVEMEYCFLPSCKVNGAWSSWSLWSVCSVTCGLGEQVRTRTCDEPSPAYGGDDCVGDVEERRDCANIPCPVDGGWSSWSKWSNCSATCGEGVQIRSRSCDSPIPDYGGQTCDGSDRETMPCVTRINCPVDGNWTEWTRWDICSARPCSGKLGHRVRYRTCTNPRPMFGGRTCRGRTWYRQACYNNDFCTEPVDGGWCEWVDWSSCSVGIQTRSRLCECPPPVNGGQDCTGIKVEEKSCQSISLLNSSVTETTSSGNEVI